MVNLNEITDKELRILIFLTRTRVKNEARRRRHLVIDGQDIQNLKVRELADLLDKLEAVALERKEGK